MIPPTTTTITPMPSAMIATISSAAPTPRGIPCLRIQATSGDATAATIPAASTGSTITWVRASSHTAPTRSSATPTSSHAVRPTSRSHCGTTKMSVSWRGSISMYGSLSRPGSSPSLSPRQRPRSSGATPQPARASFDGLAVALPGGGPSAFFRRYSWATEVSKTTSTPNPVRM